MRIWVGILVAVLVTSISCTEYTPKPRGYFRIELDTPRYSMFSSAELPYLFNISQLVKVEPAPQGSPEGWINLVYPSLNVTLYCSYFPVSPATLEKTETESRALVARLSKNTNAIKEQAYSNPDAAVYGSLFLLDDESASPVQFMLTDSVSCFFRGALYYDCIPNADSLAPVTEYLQQDVIELIQSFNWKK